MPSRGAEAPLLHAITFRLARTSSSYGPDGVDRRDSANGATFTQPLTRIDSIYFSATVFATVGFGDITAKGQGTRVLVTIQMMLDLVVVGLVVRLVVNAIIGTQRQS